MNIAATPQQRQMTGAINPGAIYAHNVLLPPQGMSTGTKVAIGVGIVAALGAAAWFARSKHWI